MALIITTENPEFSYGDTPVLRSISLSIEAGEVVCLLGPNGVGKTIFAENLLGFLSPTAGRVRVLDTDPYRVDADFRARIGLVQQSWTDHAKWRVRDWLERIRSVQLTAARRVSSVGEVSNAVDLSEKVDSRLSRLSGGQRRTIDFAAVLVAIPEFLVLDEPTTGLDPVSKTRLHDLILARVGDDVTIIMTTYDLAEAEHLASRVLIMNEERTLAGGIVTALYERLDRDVEIIWVQNGTHHVHSTHCPERFVKELDLDTISALTIARSILEEAYSSLVNKEAHS